MKRKRKRGTILIKKTKRLLPGRRRMARREPTKSLYYHPEGSWSPDTQTPTPDNSEPEPETETPPMLGREKTGDTMEEPQHIPASQDCKMEDPRYKGFVILETGTVAITITGLQKSKTEESCLLPQQEGARIGIDIATQTEDIGKETMLRKLKTHLQYNYDDVSNICLIVTFIIVIIVVFVYLFVDR